MRNKLIAIIYFLILSVATGLHATPLPKGVTVLIQPESGTTYDTYTLQLNINWENHKKQPEIKSNDDFEIVGRGQNSGSFNINGDISLNISYQYLLKPKKTGKLRVPDIILYKDNKKYRLVGKTITVSDKQNYKKFNKKEDKIILDLTANKLSAYKGEQLFVRTELLVLLNIDKAEVVENDFNNAWIENVDPKPFFRKVINGKKYSAAGVENIVFPNESGKFIIPPRKFKLSVVEVFKSNNSYDYLDSFFRRVNKRSVIAESNNLIIDVKELPKPTDKLFLPKNSSTPVGITSINSSLSADRVKVGDSITLKFTIKSFGLINSIKDLDVNVPDFVNIYRDKPKIEKKISDKKVQYTKIFSYSLVPTKAKNFTIGEIKLSYFNPTNGKYDVASNKAISIEVLEDKSIIKNNTANPKIQIEANEIPATKSDVSNNFIVLLKELSESISTGLGLLVLSIVIFTISITLLLVKFLRNKSNPLPDFDNMSSSLELYQEYKKFVEDKLTLHKSSLNDEIRLLLFKKYPENIALRVMSTLKELEELSFSKANSDLHTIKEEIRNLIKEL